MKLETIEANLLKLNLDKDRYKNEFDKIPEAAKTIAQRRRREFLEQELKAQEDMLREEFKKMVDQCL